MNCPTVVKRIEEEERSLSISRYLGRPKGLLREDLFFRDGKLHVGRFGKRISSDEAEIVHYLAAFFGCLPDSFRDDMIWLVASAD